MKWDVPQLVKHKATKQYVRMLSDKYGYEYEQGKQETIPLSFYFDMSGSMSRYSKLLSQVAYELLRSGVKVLIGYNEQLHCQIDEIDKSVTKQELYEFITDSSNWGSQKPQGKQRIKAKKIDARLDTYLIDRKAEKVIVFADFDPAREVATLSKKSDVYWMCFDSNYKKAITYYKFNGFVAKTTSEKEILETLEKFNSTSYKTLRFQQRDDMGVDTTDVSRMSRTDWDSEDIR